MSVRWAFKINSASDCRRLADGEEPADGEVLYIGRYSQTLVWDGGAIRERNEVEREAAMRSEAVGRVKRLARSTILARLPEWKQANMTARAVELVALGQTGGAEWAAMQSAWNWIKAVRTHSDALEAAVQQSNDPASVDIETGWPE